MNRILSRAQKVFLTSALVLALGGCVTNVAVDPQADNSTAKFQYGTLKGPVNAGIQPTFEATNRALDGLGYFRVGQRVSDEKTGPMKTATVVARGVKDVKITVEITPGKEAGTSILSVDVDPTSLPKEQEIFSNILKQLNSAGAMNSASSAPPPGFSAPARP